MREIKFRAWVFENEMVEVEYMHHGKPMWIDMDSQSLCDYGDNPVLMQFTGLTDKNGKEIYEGDILKGTEYGKDVTIKVEWKHGFDGDSAPFAGYLMDIDADYEFNYKPVLDTCEVIGNIYENPNLLK